MACEHHDNGQNGSPKQKNFWHFASNVVALIIIAIIGYYLITQHSAHIAGFFASFPWWILIFLLCPLMHFMHGHGGHGDHGDHEKHSHPEDENKNPSEKKG